MPIRKICNNKIINTWFAEPVGMEDVCLTAAVIMWSWIYVQTLCQYSMVRTNLPRKNSRKKVFHKISEM